MNSKIPSATVFAWQANMVLGHATMDQVHMECVARINELLACTDDGIEHAFDRLVSHLDAHFAQEERQMHETAYNGASCHVDEHKAVLTSASEVRLLLTEGRTDIARRFVQHLADWLPKHISNMDHSLADWLLTRRADGLQSVRIFKT